MRPLRNVVQVGLAIWAAYVVCMSGSKLRSGMTSVSYEHKHVDEVLYPSLTICPTYSTLGPYFKWQLFPKPPQVDSNHLNLITFNKIFIFKTFTKAKDIFLPHSELLEFTHYLTKNR